jgi:predicted DNA-binding transcriptional regulator AlpA
MHSNAQPKECKVSKPSQENMDIEFWSIDKVVQGQGISKSTWYTLVRNHEAPQPVKTTGKRKAWVKREVMEYRQKLIDERDVSLNVAGYRPNSTINS